MNIARSFVDLLQDQGYGTFGTDIFIGGAPLEVDTCFWVLSAGGAPVSSNITGERQKEYVVSLFYRNTDSSEVYETMQEIEEFINSDACTQLDGYNTTDMRTTLFPTDQDLDVQDRTVGLLEVTLQTYL